MAKVLLPNRVMAATLSTELRGNAKDKDKKYQTQFKNVENGYKDTTTKYKRLQQKLFSGKRTDSIWNSWNQGVGPAAVEAIFSAGPYESLEDFMDKVEKRKCNKKVILALIMAGAFDFDCPNRIDLLRRFAEKERKIIPNLYM